MLESIGIESFSGKMKCVKREEEADDVGWDHNLEG